jgi:hypothetical protein
MEDQTLQFSSHFIVEKKMIYGDAGQPTENKKQEKERGENRKEGKEEEEEVGKTEEKVGKRKKTRGNS